jgi:hypothetical protein
LKERVPAILFYPPLFFKHYFAGRRNKSAEGGKAKGAGFAFRRQAGPHASGRKVNPVARVFNPARPPPSFSARAP